MKSSFLRFFIFSLSLIFSILLKGQDSISYKIKDPDFLFQPVYVDNSFTQITIPLDKHMILAIEGVVKTKQYFLLGGISSLFRINNSDSISFVIKQGNMGSANIQQQYRLFKVEPNIRKQNRSVLFHTFKQGLGGNTSSIYEQGLPINFKKVRDDVYLISIINLFKGEYAIVFGDSIYSFGID